MRRANAIQTEIEEITTVKDLTGVFESIASTQVAKIKSKVTLSKEFFDLIWRRYSSIRVDPNSRITHRGKDDNDKKVFVIISAEAGLSGDIDQRLIEAMLADYDKSMTDIVVLGSHGANQLAQRGIPFIRHFQVPESESYIDVGPVIDAISSYSQVTVYYEEYVSLGVQGIKKIDLISTIKDMSEDADMDEDLITSEDTLFEPSLDEIADQMEIIMMNLAFSQTILESQLAQDASRFNAMAVAKKRANELLTDSRLEFHRSKRSESDRRLREVMVSLKKKNKIRRRR
ncbi:MAG TPA: F0F1 ATP synthase subunit gamma [Candidatus Saccharimonadales bacterium]|nr:F0F1 ATP synthase subunit gamma [Candidatus Saccharimonadales bacterium]